MERAAVAPRAARKSEWLRGVLAHHHSPDPGADNEIVVLATGIDQYLQEVFHHLAHPGQDDAVSAEDFRALCAALGLSGAHGGQKTLRRKDGGGENDELRDEFQDVCSDLPRRLTFKDFHSRLCGYFRVRGALPDTGAAAWRLPVSEDTELVERQIRLRWPRVRRRKCVSFDLRDQNGSRSRTAEEVQLDEVGALRELVEDLRSALQGSDARCLALEVALRRGRSSTCSSTNNHSSTITPSIASTHHRPADSCREQLGGAQVDGGRRVVRSWDLRDPIFRELKLIRSSRDGQLEEAIRFNQRLEEELHWAYQEVHRLQGVESTIRKENTQIRRRAEEAREALRMGLQRVQLIQEQAQSVPRLRSRISRLEEQLLQYRSCCSSLSDPIGPLSHPEDCGSETDAECLQRAVEGRAASDEEEEDRGRRRQAQCCRLEVKRHTSLLNGYGDSHPPDKQPSSSPENSRWRCSWTGPKQEKPAGNRGCGKGKICYQEWFVNEA